MFVGYSFSRLVVTSSEQWRNMQLLLEEAEQITACNGLTVEIDIVWIHTIFDIHSTSFTNGPILDEDG